MINYVSTRLSPLSIHYIGRQADEEELYLSETDVEIQEDYLMEMILKYFLQGFKEPAFHAFTSFSGELEDNPIYTYAKEIFNDKATLHKNSQAIAQFLYNNSKHPNIKAGELMVCYLEDIMVDDELLNAIGIFKSESKDAFLQLIRNQANYSVSHDKGISLTGLDKGCLILETEQESGYKLCVLDKANKSEAHFWTKEFLNIKEKDDEYHFTKHYINLTKDYIEDRLKPANGIKKDEEFAIMNASEKFFQHNEVFNEQEYVADVFGGEALDDFNDYKREQQRNGGMALSPEFDINYTAVKNSSKVFKSVLKLDKNFSVYVHGDRKKIMRGEDDQGKFYKLYYEEEK